GEAANPDSLFVCRRRSWGFAHPYVRISSTTIRLSLNAYHRSHVGIRESQSRRRLRIADCGLRIEEDFNLSFAICGFRRRIRSQTSAIVESSILDLQSSILNPRSAIFFVNQVFLFAVVPTRPEQPHMMRLLV